MTAHPIAILGAGPVGLAAAAHAARRGLAFIVLEQAQAGAAVAQWGHVRVFSPWRHVVDAAARALLMTEGWQAPDDEGLPTGAEIVRDYLVPLAAHPAIAPHLRIGSRVVAVTRAGRSKLGSDGRDDAPFAVRWRDAAGREGSILARAVIDATGAWATQNPIGLDGLPVPGEADHADRIAYGIPDAAGAARAQYAGRHTLVVGAGHSAINAVLDLMKLQEDAPATRITWGTRGGGIARLLVGGLNEELPGRGRLGLRAAEAIASGRLTLLSPLEVERIASAGQMLAVTAKHAETQLTLNVDRIVCATGVRPDLSAFRELRLSLDPVVEAPVPLAPLIDPNLHSCGTVPPHGVVELAHPERDFYIVGMKSYGRAPTFLMATGYEQARSVVAELAGDPVAARQVRLALPETGACGTARAAPAECCGGPAPEPSDACCVRDAVAKAAGDAAGCGCDAAAPADCCGRAA